MVRYPGMKASMDWRIANGDFYKTPPYITEALLRVESFEGEIWEPACGSGWMSEVLIDAGHEVISTDLHERGYGSAGVDFLSQDRQVANIITNPPYVQKLHLRFARHALQLAERKVAFFMPLSFLEGTIRGAFLRESPLKAVYLFEKRVWTIKGDYAGKLAAKTCFAWFVWQHGWKTEPVIRWIGDP